MLTPRSLFMSTQNSFRRKLFDYVKPEIGRKFTKNSY